MNNQQLTIKLFGPPAIALNGEKVTGFASRKAEALLIFLAYNRRVHARETLATLLWDDRSHEQALANLSVLLSSLRKNVGDFLAITRHEVGLIHDAEIEVDTQRFEVQLGDAAQKLITGEKKSVSLEALQQAMALYTDDFLSGFSLRDASGFEEWLFIERERLQRLAIDALEQIAQVGLAEGRLGEAINSLRRLQAIDPLHEPGYRLLMEALTRDGQRSAAMEIFQECQRRLRAELNVMPAAETIALYELIREDGFRRTQSAAPTGESNTNKAPIYWTSSIPVMSQKPSLHHNLPKPLNNFIGREKELAELGSLLADETYRLISLVGPGGNGKTRLAIESGWQASEQQHERFIDGVWLIELDALHSADQILDAVADVLGYRFVDGQRRLQELLNYLQQRKMLLLFDNFEHLLDGSEIVKQVLQQSPGIAALVTSRSRLNLAGETVVEIGGLDLPPDEQNHAQIQYYSAIQLFIDRAQRIDSNFRLTPTESAQLLRICQQLDGVPLAIELAAAWVRVLSCGEIAHELAQNIDFLATTTRGTSQRHNSLRTVFEHSWRLLTSDEQRSLAQLAIFRGGFTRQTAAAIAETSLRTLVALHDKSLLRRRSGNRYTLHPLIGQFSLEKLTEIGDAAQACRERHARYFASFLKKRKEDLEQRRQLEALSEMDSERENLRAAYHWALAQADLDSIELAMEAFLAYLDVRCHGIEAMEMAERTQQVLEPLALTGDRQAHHLWGEAMVYHAMFRSFEYDNDRAAELAQQAMYILQAHRDMAGVAFSHNSLGLAQMQRGEIEKALLNFEKAAELRKTLGKDALVASSLINVAQIAWRRGEFHKAEEICRTALLHAQKSENPWRIAMVLNVLGILAKELERYDDAANYLLQSAEAYRAVGNRWGISSIVSESGIIAFLQKKYTLARSYFEQSIAIRRDLGNVIHRAGDIIWLGKVAEAQEEYDKAEAHYRAALQLLEPMDEPINKASADFLLTKLLVQQNRLDQVSAFAQLKRALQRAQMGDSQLLVEEITAEIRRLGGSTLSVTESPNLPS